MVVYNNNHIVSKLVVYAQSTITVISGRYNNNSQYRVKNGSNNKQASKSQYRVKNRSQQRQQQVSVSSQKWSSSKQASLNMYVSPNYLHRQKYRILPSWTPKAICSEWTKRRRGTAYNHKHTSDSLWKHNLTRLGLSHSPATTQHENRRTVGCGDEHAEWPSCSTPRAKAAKRVIQYRRQQTQKHVKGIVLRQSWVTATACQWGEITDCMPVRWNYWLHASEVKLLTECQWGEITHWMPVRWNYSLNASHNKPVAKSSV